MLFSSGVADEASLAIARALGCPQTRSCGQLMAESGAFLPKKQRRPPHHPTATSSTTAPALPRIFLSCCLVTVGMPSIKSFITQVTEVEVVSLLQKKSHQRERRYSFIVHLSHESMPLRFLAGTQYVTHLSEAVPIRFSLIKFGVASELAGRPMTDAFWAFEGLKKWTFEGLKAVNLAETSSFLRKKSA